MSTANVWSRHEVSIDLVRHLGMFNVYHWVWDEVVASERLNRQMFDNIADAVSYVAAILRDHKRMSAEDISDAIETIIGYGVTWDFLYEPENEFDPFMHCAYMLDETEEDERW